MITDRVYISFLQQISATCYSRQSPSGDIKYLGYTAKRGAEQSHKARELLFESMDRKSLDPKPDASFYCVRVYPDGSAKYTIRDEDGLLSWLVYNHIYRPGNALFVDSFPIVESPGYFSDDALAHVQARMSRQMRKTAEMKPQQMRMVHAVDEPSRVRYPDDRELYPDFSDLIRQLRRKEARA